ncbi:MAG: hypothetical protein ACM3H7_08640 [Acidobacteriaceae bacterium]
MKISRPVAIILIGFICVLLGAFLPYLMVMRFVKSTFFLNFFAYSISVVGLFLGLIGSAMHVKYTRKKKSDTFEPPAAKPQDGDQDW